LLVSSFKEPNPTTMESKYFRRPHPHDSGADEDEMKIKIVEINK
jgi:hypothetical protein